ncbi:DUF5994 family protein [Streptomyces smyrnaeus]|uniref:DUF5994 family protein n=1 Tax=Streptomyces smyrnaeus TaxID=1387713 RepID=UPI0036B7B753
METLVTIAIVLIMIFLGALVLHLLKVQQAGRIADHDDTRFRPRPRRAGKQTGTSSRPLWRGVLTVRRSSSAGPATTPPVLLRADARTQPVAPGTAVLRLETTSDRTAMFDGAWWPRSREAAAQLPALITALTARLGPIARVGLDSSAWEDAPRSLVIDGHTVRVDWSPVGDNTMIVTRGEQDHFSFLLIPPQAPAPTARTAMTMATRADHNTSATQILTASGIVSTPAGPAS